MISLRLPIGPSVNSMYHNRKRGRGYGRILTEEARRYKQRAIVEFRRQTSLAIQRGLPWSCPVKVEIHFYPETRRKLDPGNFTKGLFDAFNGFIWKDDTQIVDQRLIKKGIKKPGFIEVFLWAVGQDKNVPDTETVAGEGQAITDYPELSTRFGCTEDGE